MDVDQLQFGKEAAGGKKKKIRGQNSRYEYACNQIFATCSSLKKKKKKRVSGILKREPCQIWISEVEPWSRPTNVILDTPCYIEIYVFNTRKRDQFFKPTRGKRFTKERERERGPKGKAALSVCVYLYTVRGKSFPLSKEKFEFCYYDLTDEYYFLKFSCFSDSKFHAISFKQLIYSSFFYLSQRLLTKI